jgi:hypothetical protein
LRGLDISSNGVPSIVDRAPRLFTLILAETGIDDDALTAIARRPPLFLLDVSHTSITAEGLRPLSGAQCAVHVEGTGISRDDMKNLNIDVDVTP